MKDVLFLVLVGVVAFVLALLIKFLMFMSHLLVLGGFVYFCYWFYQQPKDRRLDLRRKVFGTLDLLKAVFVWR